MPIETLPPELLLLIVHFLPSDEDHDSLRISCRKFRNLLPRPRTVLLQPGSSRSSFYRFSNVRGEAFSRLNYLRRLFHPGNIFHGDPNATICNNCLVIRPSTKFPMDFRVDGYRRCEECIVRAVADNMDLGCWMEYKGRKYGLCVRCEAYLEEDELHRHVDGRWDESPEYFCAVCHHTHCNDAGCSGWPVEELIRSQGRFCTGIDRTGQCGVCVNCKTIEAIKRRD